MIIEVPVLSFTRVRTEPGAAGYMYALRTRGILLVRPVWAVATPRCRMPWAWKALRAFQLGGLCGRPQVAYQCRVQVSFCYGATCCLCPAPSRMAFACRSDPCLCGAPSANMHAHLPHQNNPLYRSHCGCRHGYAMWRLQLQAQLRARSVVTSVAAVAIGETAGAHSRIKAPACPRMSAPVRAGLRVFVCERVHADMR